ncbi:MAG: winged helix-turn-helix transcriptional regulator [Caldisericales bacterium]|nr:winged helix-turn-helix transcriptional regulator [Caldisericales bacterium]
MKYLDDNDEKELQEVSDIFSALSSTKRLKIISLIGNKALSVTEIAQRMECRPPCVSQHLSVLKSCKIVDCERVGHEVVYKLSLSCVKSFISCLLGKCDSNDSGCSIVKSVHAK